MQRKDTRNEMYEISESEAWGYCADSISVELLLGYVGLRQGDDFIEMTEDQVSALIDVLSEIKEGYAYRSAGD